MTSQPFSVTDLMDILVGQVGLPASARTDDSDVTLTDLGLDSLAYLQLQVALEARYGLDLPGAGPRPYPVGEIVAMVNAELEGVRA
jgi:minimal PKS acyl carrier protein